jgi:hypothetical protein
MIKRILKKGVIALSAAVCLIPATVFASTSPLASFSMSGNSSSNSTYSSSSGVLTIDYTDLMFSINGGSATNDAGTFVEKYTNSTGVLTLMQTGGTNNISLTIDEAKNLVTNSGFAISLYSAPTSLTFNSAFLSLLGLATNPGLANVPASLQTLGVTVQSNNTVQSATLSMEVVSTPEPSTFALLGIALLSGIVYKARRRSLTNLL